MSSTPHETEPKWWHSAWVKAGAIAVILIVGFYAHQNLLGAMAWKAVQRDLAAAGESLDPASLIPAPIPDEQNLGALPIFQLTPGGNGGWKPQALAKALERVKDIRYSEKEKPGAPTQLPFLGSWKNGNKPDLVLIHAQLAELCHLPATSKMTSLELLGQLCPALAELRAANATHPDCLFYLNHPLPIRKQVMSIQLKLWQILEYEERLALLENQPAVALEDLELGWKVNAGLRTTPGIVSLLVSIIAIRPEIIAQGLADHAWTDDQLAELDQQLGKLDFLASYQLGIRASVALDLIPSLDQADRNRGELSRYLESLGTWPNFGPPPWNAWWISPWPNPLEDWRETATPIVAYLAPSGWVTRYKADGVRYRLLQLVPLVDPSAHRVFPEQEKKALEWFKTLPTSDYWRDLVADISEPLCGSVRNLTAAQVHVDQARIACRLERYRLAHGDYPETLDALASIYGKKPTDPITGEAYHYRHLGPGSFRLYSVGWDGKNDGSFDRHNADWTWYSGPS